MSIDSLISVAADEAQALLDAAYRRTPTPPAGSPLDQAGLRDGASIVRDYLAHGEAGLAFEHLLYMIDEAELVLSEPSRRKIREAGCAMGFPARVYAAACGHTKRDDR